LTSITSPQPEAEDDSKSRSRANRGGPLAVAKVIFFGLLMIGKKGTWEKDGIGAQLTTRQIVAGAVVGGLVVVVLLLLIVRIVIGFAVG
jgi:hypothetical protein